MHIKVTTSAPTRFHIFDQAYQLHRHGLLHNLITQYPKYKTRKWNIPDDKVTSFLTAGISERILSTTLSRLKMDISPNYRRSRHKQFSERIAQSVPLDTDILIGLSSFMLEAIPTAKTNHIITIVDHGSLHEQSAKEVLQEECDQFGFRKFGNWCNDWLIEKENAEFSCADWIMVCSNLAKKTLIDNGIPAKKIFANPLGADLNVFYPGVKSDKKFRVIFCGGMTPLKGIHYLVQAFSELDLPDSELWLIGDPPQDPRLMDLLKKFLRKNIVFKGTFPQPALRELYIEGSVFVLPSLCDGWGMVVIQAMACGLPVIVSEWTGAAEAVIDGDSGFVITVRSVDALKEKLLFLYEHHSTCLEMGKNAHGTVQNGFSWTDYGDRLKNVLEQIISSSK